ncbi:PP2C family protein-serine/threonine phosphatase [Nonomuraea soli]|uniref:Serine phosphatase RsbU (Regulator of sigma subunit) n=1 Tax=Nonomuraea soli TaxID=1032476 RepID=A0A7W0CKG9_9ACTN|nr:PP2C family protein-serine/threonine phosphatase [Nonomuraea soli]MBA2892849.1 serine phosphatase RsbU (regulator of sigma subunit) [Nonomuraea soli]
MDIETEQAVSAPEAVWEVAPYPLLVVSPSGTVEVANAAARALLPDAAPGVAIIDAAPAWLSQAYAQGPIQAVSGPIGERTYEAHPSMLGAGTAWWFADDTDHRLAREELRLERERTAFLSQASTELLSSLNMDRCMEVTARLATRHLADAALVITPRAGRRYPIAYCGPDGRVVRESLVVDPGVVPGLAEALQGFPPMPSRWIDPTAAPEWLARPEFGPVGSVVVTALPGHGVPAGVLVLLRRTDQAAFTDSEEIVARLFAARAGAAMSAARLYTEQVSITETLMRELLPPKVQRLDGVDIAARYRASVDSELVGGDFYDLHPATQAGQESLIVLGDVCGKGLRAAVLTGKIRNTLHALLPMAADHQRVLGLLNDVLMDEDNARFVTLVLASVRRDAHQVTLRLTSAGHPLPFVVRNDGTVEDVDSRGTLIGALPTIRSNTAEVVLQPGETCLLYTDGITEAKGGPLGDEFFGENRLRDELQQCAGMPPQALAERIQMLASEWVGGGHHDDMAVIAITAPRGRHLSAVGGRSRGRYTA